MNWFERFIFKRMQIWLVCIVCTLLFFMSYVIGILSYKYDLFPIPAIREVIYFVNAPGELVETTLLQKIENDTGLEPSRYLHPRLKLPGAENLRDVSGTQIFDDKRLTPAAFVDEEASDDLILIYGVFEFLDGRFGSVLYDPVTNSIIRHWVVAPNSEVGNPGKGGFDPDTGYLFFNFDASGILAVDFCGKQVWNVENITSHHSIEPNKEGAIWHFDGIYLVKRDIRSGVILKRFSFLDVIRANPNNTLLHLKLFLKGWWLKDTKDWVGVGRQDLAGAGGEDVSFGDPFHANDIQQLVPAAFNSFSPPLPAGEYVGVSLRAINTILIIDTQTLKIVHSLVGRTSRQHDVDFNRDGSITIFDNNTHIGPIQIVEWDPIENSVVTVFDGGKFQHINEGHGNHTRLNTDEFLIVDFLGRVYVTKGDRPVLVFDNRYDQSQSLEIRNAWPVSRQNWHRYITQCE